MAVLFQQKIKLRRPAQAIYEHKIWVLLDIDQVMIDIQSWRELRTRLYVVLVFTSVIEPGTHLPFSFYYHTNRYHYTSMSERFPGVTKKPYCITSKGFLKRQGEF